MESVTTGSAVAESPASAPVSSPSEPSAASSSPADNTRPTSFVDAFTRAGESATPDPVSSTPPVDSPPPAATAPATTEPVETAAATPEKEKKGSIPLDRHESVLKNAREKTAGEVESKFRETHKDSLKFGADFDRDPVGTVKRLIGNMLQQPDRFPNVSELAHVASPQRATAPQQADEPQPDFQTPDGATFYSAAAQAKREAWLVTKITNQVKQSLIDPLQQQMEPLVSREHLREQTEREQAREAAATGEMKELYNDYESQPYFKDHKAAIGARTLALMKEGKHPERAIAVAYREIVLNQGVADRQQQLTASAVAKATGATVVPGSVVSASAKRPRSFTEGFSSIPGINS